MVHWTRSRPATVRAERRETTIRPVAQTRTAKKPASKKPPAKKAVAGPTKKASAKKASAKKGSSGSKKAPPKQAPASPSRARLAVMIDGKPLAENDARTLWQAFSLHMDEHEGDTAGFAAQKGWSSIKPEYRAGQAVLVVTT